MGATAMTWWLFPWILPMMLQGYLLGLLSLMFGITRYPSFSNGVLQLYWRPWFERRWRYSTTIGACMGLHSQGSSWVEWHEWVHIRQYEDMCLLGTALGGLLCVVDWRVGLIAWASSGPLWLLPNFVSGWIRFGDPYMGSEHERSAYSQTYVQREGVRS